MEISYAIFKDVESFGNGKFLKMAMKKFWVLVRETSIMS